MGEQKEPKRGNLSEVLRNNLSDIEKVVENGKNGSEKKEQKKTLKQDEQKLEDKEEFALSPDDIANLVFNKEILKEYSKRYKKAEEVIKRESEKLGNAIATQEDWSETKYQEELWKLIDKQETIPKVLREILIKSKNEIKISSSYFGIKEKNVNKNPGEEIIKNKTEKENNTKWPTFKEFSEKYKIFKNRKPEFLSHQNGEVVLIEKYNEKNGRVRIATSPGFDLKMGDDGNKQHNLGKVKFDELKYKWLDYSEFEDLMKNYQYDGFVKVNSGKEVRFSSKKKEDKQEEKVQDGKKKEQEGLNVPDQEEFEEKYNYGDRFVKKGSKIVMELVKYFDLGEGAVFLEKKNGKKNSGRRVSFRDFEKLYEPALEIEDEKKFFKMPENIKEFFEWYKFVDDEKELVFVDKKSNKKIKVIDYLSEGEGHVIVEVTRTQEERGDKIIKFKNPEVTKESISLSKFEKTIKNFKFNSNNNTLKNIMEKININSFEDVEKRHQKMFNDQDEDGIEEDDNDNATDKVSQSQIQNQGRDMGGVAVGNLKDDEFEKNRKKNQLKMDDPNRGEDLISDVEKIENENNDTVDSQNLNQEGIDDLVELSDLEEEKGENKIEEGESSSEVLIDYSELEKEEPKLSFEMLSMENRGIWERMSDKAKDLVGDSWDFVKSKFPDAGRIVGKFRAGWNQVWMRDNEKELAKLKKESDNFDRKKAVNEKVKEEMKRTIEKLKQLGAPGGESLMLKIKDYDKRNAKLDNEKNKIQTKIEYRDNIIAKHSNRRDAVADKLINGYEIKLNPIENELAGLKSRREEIESIEKDLKSKHDEKKKEIEELELTKKSIIEAMRLTGDSDRKIRKESSIKGIDKMIKDSLKEMEKNQLVIDKKLKEVDKEIKRVNKKANPYRDKRDEFISIKEDRPLRVDTGRKERKSDFKTRENMQSHVSPEANSVENSAERKDTASVSQFIETINKKIAKDSSEGKDIGREFIVNSREFLKITKLKSDTGMTRKSFMKNLEDYYKKKGLDFRGKLKSWKR